MGKCINCGKELPDGANFCGKCGTPQTNGLEKASLIITHEAVIRLLKNLDINHGEAFEGTPVTENPENLIRLFLLILSIDRNLYDSEINEINAAINHLEKELDYDKKKKSANTLFAGLFYNFTGKIYSLPEKPEIQYEDERFEIITELLFRPLLEEKLFRNMSDIKAEIMCIGLLCACDGRFTRNKQKLFDKLKRMELIKDCAFYDLDKLPDAIRVQYAKCLSEIDKYEFFNHSFYNYEEDELNQLKSILNPDYSVIKLVSENGDIIFQNNKKIQIKNKNVINCLRKIEEPLCQYIDNVKNLSVQLCDLEQNIAELEKSTNCSYSEVKTKIAEEIQKENNLITQALSGFEQPEATEPDETNIDSFDDLDED